MNKMKRLTYIFAALAVLASCQQTETYDAPKVVMDAESISARTGFTFEVTGTVTAPAGIDHFSVKCAAYGIDKTYSLSDVKPTSYAFKVECLAHVGVSGEEDVIVSAVDVAGQTASGKVRVFFEKDTVKPTVTALEDVVVFLKGEGESSFHISFTAKDNQGLMHATLWSNEAGIQKIWKLSGTEETIEDDIPVTKTGTFPLTLDVFDNSGLTATATATLTVYAADSEAPVITYGGANPILIDPVSKPYKISFNANVTDNVGLAGGQIQVINKQDVNWANPVLKKEYTWSGKSASISEEITFPAPGEYFIYVYAADISTTVQEWGNSAELYVDVSIDVEEDTEKPTITFLSPTSAKVGETYTLQVEFKDNVGILSCWPTINESAGWVKAWPGEVVGTRTVLTKDYTFTSAGWVTIYVESGNVIADAAGNEPARIDDSDWYYTYLVIEVVE